MRKWIYGSIIVGVLIIIGSSIWIFAATNDTRSAAAEYDKLVEFANRQAVEIAIIEQNSKLNDYRQQLAKAKQSAAKPLMSLPPTPADPDDVPER